MTLPFVSYGGSSVIATGILVGMLLAFTRDRPDSSMEDILLTEGPPRRRPGRMDERPFLMIAAGGTGGHMFPAQALAEEMLSRGWRVCLSTDRRGFRYAGGFPESVRTLVVSSGTFSRGRLQDRVLVPVLLLAGTFSALRRIRRDRPRVVAGFGGYPAAPTLAAARLARIPTMLHEQNGVLGRVNRLFAGRVERIACSVWPMELPRGASPTVTGNPVRGSIRRNAGGPLRAAR